MANGVRQNLGPVSAYALAVKHGYTGTEEEWVRDQEEAGTYAGQAKNAAQEAIRAAEQAAESRQTASTKAEEAATSASNAAASADLASKSAKTASDAASAADLSAKGAKESADNASNSETAAGNHAHNAALSAQTATEAARGASTSEASASSAAQTASSAASTATSKAADAEHAAQSAAEDKVSASQSATSASEEASVATEKAAEATKSAESAMASASTAETAAQEAAASAEAAQNIINDETTGTTRTWSSQKIHEEDQRTWKDAVDGLAPPFEETAPIVQGHLIAGYPMHVVTRINPVQEGDGDPSPTNVRPLKAYENAKLTVCGGNLMQSDIKFYRYASRTSETTSWNQTAPGEFTGTKSGVVAWLSGNYHSGKYSLVFKRNKGFYSIRTYSVATQEELHEYINQVSISGGYRVDIEETEEFYLNIRPGEFTPSLIISNFMMLARYDSVVTVMPPYAPHSEDEFTTNFSEPVIGGRWEVDTGVVNSDFVNVPISNLFLASNTNTAFVRIVSSFVGDLPKACGYSNILKRFPGSGAYGGAAQGIYLPDKSTSIDILVSVDNLIPYGAVQGNRGTYLQAAKNYLTTNQAVLIGYNPGKKLQVQPLTVAAKKGITTVYSDTGDTTVTAREDPVYINKILQSRIAALEESITQMMEV